MIWYSITYALVFAFNFLFQWLPKATALPFGMDSALQQASGALQGFIGDFWLLQLPWTLTLWYLGLLLTLMVLRLLRIIR